MKKQNTESTSQSLNEILNFLENKSQFKFALTNGVLELKQSEDNKKMNIRNEDIDKVLARQDLDGSPFLQVNFASGGKILITQSLIGFKPYEVVGFDAARIPRVVTTVDLLSVSKAIEQFFDADETPDSKAELEILKKVYQSILLGAEKVGFKMTAEKNWFSSILINPIAFAS